ncbi:MAG: formate dehydrogenase accessory sulfurtransferase FdhD [Candidatus Saccharibacteria bacterium]
MEEVTTILSITRYDSEQGDSRVGDAVISEYPLSVSVNGRELVTLMCTPQNLENLAVGFLAGEGFIQSYDEILDIRLDREQKTIFIKINQTTPAAESITPKKYLTTGLGKGPTFNLLNLDKVAHIQGEYEVPPADILTLMGQLQENSELHRLTGGVHTAALAQDGKIIVQRDDIGRHNAVDKVVGYCLQNKVDLKDKLLLVSGRISSEIAYKASNLGIQILISRSAPTSLAVSIAEELGLTLVGFTRGSRFNIYTHPHRVSYKRRDRMVPVVCFVGNHNSGKTTVLMQIVKLLKANGYRVGVIKHSHKEFAVDVPGKDSERLAEAGADAVAISSPQKVAYYSEVLKEKTLTEMVDMMGDLLDVVLVEGYKEDVYPKIEVARQEISEEFLNPNNLVGIITDIETSRTDVPVFGFDEVEALFWYLETKFFNAR